MTSVIEANLADAARVLGVSVPTLRNYVVQGMPVQEKGGRGKDYVLCLPKCVEWLAQLRVKQAVGDTGDADANELKLRQLRAQTTIAEIDAAKAKDEVVLKEDARRLFTMEAVAVKAAFMSIPGKVSAVLAGVTVQREIREILFDEITFSLKMKTPSFAKESAIFLTSKMSMASNAS